MGAGLGELELEDAIAYSGILRATLAALGTVAGGPPRASFNGDKAGTRPEDRRGEVPNDGAGEADNVGPLKGWKETDERLATPGCPSPVRKEDREEVLDRWLGAGRVGGESAPGLWTLRNADKGLEPVAGPT